MMRIACTVLLALTAILPAQAAAADLEEIKERGVLRVAIANLSPFIITKKDGTLEGFEIDSTRALAEHLGVEIEYVERPFCELADAVVDGEADMIASGFSNTPARRRILDFSLPYHDTEYYLVISKEAARKAKTMRGINRKDITIGFQEGGVSGEVARGDFGGADLEGFSSFTEIMKALRNGKVDGAVLFSPYQEMADKMRGRDYMVPHKYALTRTIEAFAMAQGSDALRDALNEWVIARDLDGYWDELEKQWFDPENMQVSAPPPYACPGKIPVQ